MFKGITTMQYKIGNICKPHCSKAYLLLKQIFAEKTECVQNYDWSNYLLCSPDLFDKIISNISKEIKTRDVLGVWPSIYYIHSRMVHAINNSFIPFRCTVDNNSRKIREDISIFQIRAVLVLLKHFVELFADVKKIDDVSHEHSQQAFVILDAMGAILKEYSSARLLVS